MRRISLLLSCSVLLCSLAMAQGTFYRAADGKWKPLKTSTTATLTKFTLSPQDIGGGSTLVVVNKPAWMVLDDDKAPALMRILLDGQERKPEELDLGKIAQAPRELVFAVQDDKNPLDLVGLQVLLNNQPVNAKQITTTRLSPTAQRVAIKLGELPPATYTLYAALADQSPAHNTFELALKFSTSPIVANGSFEEADETGKPVSWQPGSWGGDDVSSFQIDVQPGGVNGQKALRFSTQKGGNLVCPQSIDVLKPETPYVFTGQYKTEGGSSLSVITYDEAGKEIDYLNQGLPAAKDWTPFSWEFQVKPHVKATVVLRFGSKGEAWFDDVQVKMK